MILKEGINAIIYEKENQSWQSFKNQPQVMYQ